MYVAEHPGNEPATLDHDGTGSDGALSEYLDHVEFDDYVVTIDQDTSTGKFSYSITTGTILTNLGVTSITEQQLIDISNGTSVEDATATEED
jgi:hypothetical protein